MLEGRKRQEMGRSQIVDLVAWKRENSAIRKANKRWQNSPGIRIATVHRLKMLKYVSISNRVKRSIGWRIIKFISQTELASIILSELA